jgi:hypothetical protein
MPIHRDYRYKPAPLRLYPHHHYKRLPKSPPHSETIALLAQENQNLRTEVQRLREQHDMSLNQVRRYYLISEASKAFLREASSAIRLLQQASVRMEQEKMEANQAWTGMVDEEEDNFI